MYKSVYDLSPAEMEELRQSYFTSYKTKARKYCKVLQTPNKYQTILYKSIIAAFLLWMMIFSVIWRVEKWGLYFCLCFRLC